MYCDSLAGLLLAVKHWPAERLNFIVGGRNIDGKRRTPPRPALEYMHRGCLWPGLNCCSQGAGGALAFPEQRIFDRTGIKSGNERVLRMLDGLRAEVLAVIEITSNRSPFLPPTLLRYLFFTRFLPKRISRRCCGFCDQLYAIYFSIRYRCCAHFTPRVYQADTAKGTESANHAGTERKAFHKL